MDVLICLRKHLFYVGSISLHEDFLHFLVLIFFIVCIKGNRFCTEETGL